MAKTALYTSVACPMSKVFVLTRHMITVFLSLREIRLQGKRT
jgi:hypothetical protein